MPCVIKLKNSTDMSIDPVSSFLEIYLTRVNSPHLPFTRKCSTMGGSRQDHEGLFVLLPDFRQNDSR